MEICVKRVDVAATVDTQAAIMPTPIITLPDTVSTAAWPVLKMTIPETMAAAAQQ
mgnify:CR=1 FL=1